MRPGEVQGPVTKMAVPDNLEMRMAATRCQARGGLISQSEKRRYRLGSFVVGAAEKTKSNSKKRFTPVIKKGLIKLERLLKKDKGVFLFNSHYPKAEQTAELTYQDYSVTV